MFSWVEQFGDVHSEYSEGGHEEDKWDEDVVTNIFVEIEGLIGHFINYSHLNEMVGHRTFKAGEVGRLISPILC